MCDADGKCTCETSHNCTDGEDVGGKTKLFRFPVTYVYNEYCREQIRY